MYQVVNLRHVVAPMPSPCRDADPDVLRHREFTHAVMLSSDEKADARDNNEMVDGDMRWGAGRVRRRGGPCFSADTPEPVPVPVPVPVRCAAAVIAVRMSAGIRCVRVQRFWTRVGCRLCRPSHRPVRRPEPRAQTAPPDPGNQCAPDAARSRFETKTRFCVAILVRAARCPSKGLDFRWVARFSLALGGKAHAHAYERCACMAAVRL